MGRDEAKIVEQCIRGRMPFPDAIANAPELAPGLNLFYLAFLDLTSCRTLGYSQGPIPWLAIHYYCEAHGIEGEQREDLFYHVAQLDKVYLDWSTAQVTKKTAAATDRPKPVTRVSRRK
jgi:hypothetical protein